MPSLSKLQSHLGYHFEREALLTQALTHRSFASDNNERLEFLGDAILSYVVSAALFEKFPDASEGALSRLRSRMVKQSTLADVARELDLGDYLKMGSGELKSGGFERSSILSDALEAIIGAVYLDKDVHAVSELLHHLLGSRIAQLSADDLKKDAKTSLQEYLQGQGAALPEYELLRLIGKSPNQTFEVACHSPRFPEVIKATGTSRRRAEQEAARLALASLGVEL